MREVDRLTTERYGIPGLQLMEAAGQHVADSVRYRFSGLAPLPRVAVLCGKGNNGGDGLVAARLLKEAHFEPLVLLFGTRAELHGDATTNLDRWLKISGELIELNDAAVLNQAWPRVADAHVIVDAMLGTGLKGPATGLIASAIDRLNQLSTNATLARPALILAVDTPSGLPSDGGPAEGPILRAHVTVTFTAPKVGQLTSRDAKCCGQLRVYPIGSPEQLVEETGRALERWASYEEFASIPFIRAADSHKGTFGHVLLIAGSLGKTGAAILSGTSALRGGAGLVTVATPDVVLPTVAAGLPELMTTPLPSTSTGCASAPQRDDAHFFKLLEGMSTLAIGPGLGTHPDTQYFVRKLIQESSLPTILDADGLNAFAGFSEELAQGKSRFVCLTPHPGEMARLLGVSANEVQQDRVKTAVDCAKRWNLYIILKGFHTILASPRGEVFVSTTGNAGLAKGGSGDVLTGLLAALTAQFGTQDWLRVLALGVYLHGLAAGLAARGNDLSGMLAGDIVRGIPSARARLVRELQRA